MTRNLRPAVPRHVAITMDGNGRWATARHLPRVAGHSRGVDTVRAIVERRPRNFDVLQENKNLRLPGF